MSSSRHQDSPRLPMGKISGEKEWISSGPWGGEDGVDWAYKFNGPIMQISIRYEQVIESIVFQSKSCDGIVMGGYEIIGGDGGGETKTFCIDSSVEQVSSIFLTYGEFNKQVTIHSLCINTNLNEYGASGSRTGASSVSIPLEGGVLVGFHGRLANHITAIGIFVAPRVNCLPNPKKKVDSLLSIQDPNSGLSHLKGKISDNEATQKKQINGEEEWISLGPWGSTWETTYWAYKPEGPILQMCILYGDVIDSIVFASKSYDGVVIGSPKKIGNSTGGHQTNMICIDTSEQLLSISLTYEDYYGQVTIFSISIHTNLNNYGPFGAREAASCVRIPIVGGVFAGFHGWFRDYINAIGVFVAPKINSLLSIQDLDSAPKKDLDAAQTQHKGKISDKEDEQKKQISGEEGWISLGPWGEEDDAYWAYKPDGPILQICILYGEIIDSIVFASKSYDGVVIGSPKKIGNSTGGHRTKTICIDNSVEQLSSISFTYEDYYGQVTIISVSIHTNLDNYGPFGARVGARKAASFVCIPMVGGVLAGFHGRVGKYITAIGVFVAPKINSLLSIQDLDSAPKKDQDAAPTQHKGKNSGGEGSISLGPWGGEDGVDWAYKFNGPIMQISIRYGRVIESIVFESKSSDGIAVGGSEKIGSDGGDETKTFCIDSSVEQVSSMFLTYGEFNKQVTIHSLCINTNLNEYGASGSRTGASSVSIPLEGGVLVGFHGRLANHITAIGIFVAPRVNCLPSPKKKVDSLLSIQEDPDSAPSHLKGKISNEDRWISLGPWGGKDGKDWAYKLDMPKMKISIRYGQAIYSISFNGVTVESSEISADTRGHATETFCIDTSKEQLLSISLTYEALSGKVSIMSLCFYTSQNKYGPFGLRSGASSVSIPIEGGVIAGFHGYVSTYLSALGIYVVPKFNRLHSIRDSTSVPTQHKVLGSGEDSKDNAASSSSSANTNKDDHRSGAPSPSEMIRKALNLVDSAFQKYTIHVGTQISEARTRLGELEKLGSSERDFVELGKAIEKLKFQIPWTSTNIEYFVELGKAIEKLKVQIPLTTTNKEDPNDGALSPTSKMIRSHLNQVDMEAKESMYHTNVKMNDAHEKFKELQLLQISERDSDELQKAESDKKRKAKYDELRKAMAKLKVQNSSHSKIRSANSNIHRGNWDDINMTKDRMMHLFYKEPYTHTIDGGLLDAFRKLPEPLPSCLLCFFKFPPQTPIKRTCMIYLWIGQGYISQYLHNNEGYIWDVEVHAYKIFDELIAKGFIEPIYENYSFEPDNCYMSLSVHSSLYKEAIDQGFTLHNPLDHSCLINVGEPIIHGELEIFKKMKQSTRSLYLGRWQNSATHHIELTDAKILHGLNKKLTFLSLQGISMITELPTIISELKDLMILDLRACHNLEVIPKEIGLLKSLTHLDMSECCLVERMPKSISQLSNLQVLKGFLIGGFNNNKQSCTLRDLSGMKKLRKLKICIIAKDILSLQDLKILERFEGLQKLTISWAGGSLQAQDEVITEEFHFALPYRLQKLDLQCFPTLSLLDWLMPSKLKQLKKLYIRGGKLRDLGRFLKPLGEQWTVEILSLKYLGELKINWSELRILFPNLIHLNQVDCPMLIDFPCDERGVWMNK